MGDLWQDGSLALGLRRKIGSVAADGFFQAAARLGKLHPNARPSRHGVAVEPDIPYLPDGRREHLLDLYRPVERTAAAVPPVLYLHGGGFRILSKDTHWVMGLAFARVGNMVFNASYRLAPQHRFPAALEDGAAALRWVVEHAKDYHLDLDRLVLAGESAGANLATALAVACCYRRPEPWATELWELGVTPRVLLPFCGVLQVSDPERFRRRKPTISSLLEDRLIETSRAYLGPPRQQGKEQALADPLCILERGEAPARPLPACFAAVGTLDPLLPDTRRLKAAYDELGATCEARYYPGEIHAFQAFAWREQARRCWRDTYSFLDQHLRAGTAQP